MERFLRPVKVSKLASLRRNIYSLRDLCTVVNPANERYAVFIASIDSPDAGWKAIDKVPQSAKGSGRSQRGSICLRAMTVDESS